MSNAVGIIAGNGVFPLVTAREIQRQQRPVVICAITGEASPDIASLSPICKWVKLGELGKVIRFFKENQVKQAVFAGKVEKISLFSGKVLPDLEMIKVLSSVRNWKDDSLLSAVVNKLEEHGIEVMDSTTFIKPSLAAEGILTRQAPNKKEFEDIEFGWNIARAMGDLDIGQTIIVKSKAVIAVEAIEGTDAAIRRGGELCKEGAVVIKVAKPKQDMRFDVPAVGMNTLEAMKAVSARVLAVEAGKTILLEKDRLIQAADEAGIVIIGRKS